MREHLDSTMLEIRIIKTGKGQFNIKKCSNLPLYIFV